MLGTDFFEFGNGRVFGGGVFVFGFIDFVDGFLNGGLDYIIIIIIISLCSGDVRRERC